jgi:ABC-type sugar transport system ATPase subunit
MFLEIKHISKRYKDEEVVKDLNLSLHKHKTLSILGQSGCGKTTMLKMIGGLVNPDAGTIELDGLLINHKKPEERNIVYLYQEDLLFPHLNVFENIAFGLRLKKRPEKEIREKVEAMIDSLELEGQADKMPHQLSGGQRQRVSFGRAIIINPALLLLDEPFGSLDAGTRTRMQLLFKKIAAEFSITSLFVTHDLKEAILMGDEIAFMRSGNLKVYKSKQAFISDQSTGVHQEIAFWNTLGAEQEIKENA